MRQPHPEHPYRVCGTYAGWSNHTRLKQEPCDMCQDAHAEYMREWRWRTGRVRSRLVRLSPAEQALLGAVRS